MISMPGLNAAIKCTITKLQPSNGQRSACGLVALAALMVCCGGTAKAQQTPVASVFSSVGGSYSGTYTAGSVCGGTGSGSTFTSLDTLGNGCPAKLAKFGAMLTGLGVDGAGNIFFEDYTNAQVRKIDVKTTVVTAIISTSNTVCSTTASATGQKQDSQGGGCILTSALGPATTRGMTVDPWGNVIIAGYNSNETTVACLATSPLCPGTTGRKQVGSFYRVAGCIASQGSSATSSVGTTAYTAGDGGLASPYQNLAGDVSAWGLTGTAATNATTGPAGTTGTTKCTSGTSGGVNSPRSAQADKFGNLYIADTSNTRYRVVLGPPSFNGTTNPLFAIIQQNPKYTTPTEGYIYPILGSFAAFTQGAVTYNAPTAAGSACSSASTTVTSLDALGDGCQWFETASPNTGTSLAGMGVDNDGNPIFSDNTDSSLRVMYVQGSKMAKMITAANPTVTTPTVGTVYALVGVGSGSESTTPQLNLQASSLTASNLKVAVDGADNIYLSDGKGVDIVDSNTGFLRRPIASTTSTVCSGGAANGDGCTSGGAMLYPASSVGESIAVDNLGNVYLADSTTTGVVRKVLANTLYPTAVGSTFKQTILFHEPAGTTAITPTLINASAGITLAATQPACTVYGGPAAAPPSDTTADCGVALVFTPTVAGPVGVTLSVANTGAGQATILYPITGMATAAELTTDVAAPATATYASFAASATPTSLVFDSGGNLYTVDNHSNAVTQIANSTTTKSVGTAPAGVTQVAVDASGNVYTASPSGLTVFAATGPGTWAAPSTTATTITAVAFDTQGNRYSSNGTNVVQNLVGGFASQTASVTLATGLTAVTQLAFDGQGNLLIADTGVVYRLNPVTGALAKVASSGSGGVSISGLTPKGVAGDAGGDIYIQDGASKNVYMIAAQQYASGAYSGSAITVLSSEMTPSGLAVDGLGQVYAADTGLATPAIVQVPRSSVAYTFPATGSTLAGTITNTGNVSATGTALNGSGPSEFVFTPSAPCTAIPSTTSGVLAGGDCAFSVTFNSVAGTNNTVNGILSLTTAAGTPPGALTLSGVNPTGVTTLSTTTAVSGATSAPYTTGTEASYTVTVSNTSGTNTDSPTGNVTVSIDGQAATAYPLTAAANAMATATFSVSGLMVQSGGHSIAITYSSTADGSVANTSFGGSSTSTTLTVTQVTPTVSWSPGASSVAYSAPVGLATLNATASVPGVPVYTANGVEVQAASYLAVGSYTLAGTFYPTDSVDYTTATLPTQSFAVNAATTSAPIGGSTTLVASDGTGNYTTVQAAVNALGTTGGSVYIKPGTYGDTTAANDTNGSILVSAPNVALRGLGGDPTQVILTHGGGAFGSSYPYTGQFTAAQSNGSQLPSGSSVTTGDEGSATLVVARTVNTALGSSATLTPNNFYAENLTINNVWNTDNVGTTTTYLSTAGSSGSCAVQSTAQTFSSLYNANQECASQALAIWITSDTAVLNNVYMNSLQDTVYAAAISAGSAPSRQLWFRGKISGDVDYIFGDAAAVFDHTSIYSAFHGASASGTVTIEAQSRQSNYLSGFVMNSDVFTSQAQNMTALYFGRPYNTAGGTSSNSTWIMLNSYVDQVAPIGYVATLGPTLTGSNYGEYNDAGYTDPAVGSADMNGVLYTGVGATAATGGNTGAGVLPTSAREAASTDPLYTTFNANGMNNNVGMTAAQAQQFYPQAFLGQTLTTNQYNTVATWNPTGAIATDVNSFVPSTSPSSIVYGTSLTVLMRPQTPGLGAVNTTPSVTYTIPTGTYSLSDGGTVIASGNLDAAGEASYTSASLAVGSHSFTWAFTSGDANFASSSTTTAYTVTVNAQPTTTSVAVNASPIVYGQSAGVTATVSSSGSGVTSGTVTLTIDGGTTQTASVSNGAATFTVTGLQAGTHTFAASYGGGGVFAASSSTTNATVSVTQAPLAISGSCNNRVFGKPNVCSGTVTGSYQYSDTAATVIASLGASTTAMRNSPAGSYAANPVVTLTTFGNTNYSVVPTSNNFTIMGGALQTITFSPLPNFPVGGTYQLTARSSSGLPVTYAIDSSSTGTATIVNGTTISVTGAGTIKVVASQTTDPTGDYAAATAVTRSFTAQ